MGKRVIWLLPIMAVLLLTGCGKDERTPAEGGWTEFFPEPQYEWGSITGETLTVWGTYPDLERSYLLKAFARYEEKTGNHLELVQMPKEEYAQRMYSAFHGGEEQPDIVLSYGGTSVEAYDPDVNFYDFSDAPWVEDLTDTSVNQTIYNGRIIGLPHWEASISGTLITKNI